MNFRKIYCIAAMALMCCTGSMFTSCDDYLDVDSYFDEIFELDSVFKRKEYLEEYINGAGKLLPNEGDLWTNAWSLIRELRTRTLHHGMTPVIKLSS